MSLYVNFLASMVLSLLVPSVFVFIRESVKKQRQETIRDLESVFHLPDPQTKDGIVPSFEFVKYKYFFKRVDQVEERKDDFKIIHWIISAVPLVIVMTLVNIVVLNILFRHILGFEFSYLTPAFAKNDHLPTYLWIIAASYSGGFVFMIRSFYRAINNFDLSPLSFVGACLNIVSAMIAALIFVYGIMHVFGVFTPPAQLDANALMKAQGIDSVTLGMAIIAAFAIGLMPQLATRNILWSSRLRYYKKEDIQIYKSFSAIPVEVIDGIDTEIRDKLGDFHISAVQNLAAANPLMLFVETPYGVYQIMDWVAQAQLCCSVGPKGLTKLWNLGIRTIFDLERAALDNACYDEDLLQHIGKIILDIPNPPNGAIPTTMIIADIRLRLEHPHVQRLRQIFIRVRDRLGVDSQRLPPIISCPEAANRKCPFAKESVK